MIDLPLRLRHRTDEPRETAAWLLLTPGPSDWLRIVNDCASVDPDSLRFVPLRANERTSGCHSVLVIGEGVPRSGVSHGTPFAKIGENLFVPVDADLVPSLRDEELTRLFPRGQLHVWRPAAGLVSIDDRDVLTVANLIGSPVISDTKWDRAEHGLSLPTRLNSLVPLEAPSLMRVMQSGRDDIGSQAKSIDDLSTLPPSPREGKPGLGPTIARGVAYGAAAAVGAVAGALNKLTKALRPKAGTGSKAGSSSKGTAAAGGQPGGPSWLERLSNAMNQRLKSISDSMLAKRDREIERLMHMLEQDPDKGLRFAIPFGGSGAARGTARPGSNLIEHGLNFQLPGQGGVGAVDGWSIDHQKQVALRTKYRELANREIALGRYRRAAYIFAELLDDYSAAASALRTGHHYRDAAVIYRDKLHRRADAAECLEAGGLWAEAIEDYRVLQRFEKVGDLYRQIGQEDEAISAFTEAEQLLRQKGDYLEAARIAELKSLDADRALNHLADGWPHSPQAEGCLSQRFDLLNRLDRREQGHELVEQLTDDGRSRWALTSQDLVGAVRVLARLTQNESVCFDRGLIAESTRQMVACGLANATIETSRHLVDALPILTPEDRLLKRDVVRYIEQRRAAIRPTEITTPISIASRRAKKSRVQEELTWTINAGVEWQVAATIKSTLFLAGYKEGRIALIRCLFDGRTDSLFQMDTVPAPSSSECRSLMLHATSTGDLRLHAGGSRPIATTSPWAKGDYPGECPKVACPGQADILGMCVGPGGGTITAAWPDYERLSPLLNTYDSRIGLQSTQDLDEDMFRYAVNTSTFVLPLPMAVSGRTRYVAVGRQLLVLEQGGATTVVDCDAQITDLAADLRNTRKPVVIATSAGIEMYRPGNEATERVSSSLVSPRLLWIRSGHLIAVGERQSDRVPEIYVFDSAGDELDQIESVELPHDVSQPFLSAGPHIDLFAVVDQDGHVRLYSAR